MLTFQDVKTLLDETSCEIFGYEFKFFLGDQGENKWYLQVGMLCEDSDNTGPQVYKGGKFYVSPHSTRDEVVKKVLLACLTFLEHEAREGFTWRGRRIFGPHISLEALYSVAEETTSREELESPREAEKNSLGA